MRSTSFAKKLVLMPFLFSLFLVGCLGGEAEQFQQKVIDNVAPLGIEPKEPRVEVARTRRFNGTGGYVGEIGYRYSLVGLGGQMAPGSIDAITGIYTAPLTLDANNTVAIVEVTDARGAKATTTLIVISPLQITPTSHTVTVGKKANFDVIGGQAPITWSVVDATKGTIDAYGLFTAAANVSGSTTITATDASGNVAQAVVVVRAKPTLTPTGIRVPFGWKLKMTPLEGSAPYTFKVDPLAQSGGASIDANGLLIAPKITGSMTVTVKDAYDYESNATLEVISPNFLVAGADFNCVLLSDIQGVKCWGDSTFDQTGYTKTFVRTIGGDDHLGNGINELGSRVPPLYINGGNFLSSIQLVAGEKFSCVLDSAYNVRCWGYNSNGQLGTNTTIPLETSMANASDSSNGAKRVFLNNTTGTVLEATIIAAGLHHMCAVNKADPTDVVCWGSNSSGQLGISSATVPGNLLYPRTTTGYKVDFTQTVLDIKAGFAHTCALLAAHSSTANKKTIQCWGDNSSGQLGNNLGGMRFDAPQIVTFPSGSEPVQLAVGGEHTCAVLADEKVYCWGRNDYGQTGRGLATMSFNSPGSEAINLGTNSIIKVIAGYYKTCFLLLGGKLKCVGQNTSGSLGLNDGGSILFTGTAPTDMGDNLPSVAVGSGFYVTDASVGANHICALLDDNRVKCWGDGSKGQLGNARGGMVGSTSDPLQYDMGDNLLAVGIF